nr:hypothetical protein [Tanacetum cinerariifolium]
NSPIKSKLKDTCKSNSPKSRWVLMSERVFSPQPVTKYNPITGEVRKESEKAVIVKKNSVTVVKDRDVTSKVGISNVSAVVSEKSTVVNESVVKKDNPKVTSKVSDESVKVPVVKKVEDKAWDALKNKLTGKGKKHVVGKDKDKPKNITLDVIKEKFKP